LHIVRNICHLPTYLRWNICDPTPLDLWIHATCVRLRPSDSTNGNDTKSVLKERNEITTYELLRWHNKLYMAFKLFHVQHGP